MTYETMIQYALDEGFAGAAIVDTSEIVFDPSFRPYCEENLCGQYGANYSCPPDCGSPEAMKQKVLAHKKALVLQTIWEISDYSDISAIKPAKAAHNAAEIRLIKRLRARGCDGFIVGASGCALCSPCAQTLGEPCRFPDLQYSCMSAYCIFVKTVSYTELGEGATAFYLTVQDVDGTVTKFLLHTDAATVGEALLALELIDGYETEYGLYVTSANNITADWETEKAYWAFYIDGAYAQAGVDSTEITADAVYELVKTISEN